MATNREQEIRTGRSRLFDDIRNRPLGAAAVTALLAVLAALSNVAGPVSELAAHAMYLPILIAGFFFGLAGALATGVAAGLITGPLLASGPVAGDAWPYRMALFLVAGAVAARLFALLDERRKQVIGTQIDTLRSFAVAVETEDDAAGEHCERVAENARVLGEALGLGARAREELYWAGLLHDIGKVTVPREILRKPGGLTLEEYLVMRRHARLGANLLGSIESFRRVAEAVGAHHERWDGGGYPGGLRGEAIPLFGRILAVVDVFEALTSDRPYRRALSREAALEELRRNAGVQFDPLLVEVYERLYRERRLCMAEEPQAKSDPAPQVPAMAPQPNGAQ